MPRATEPPAAMLPVEDALERILELCEALPTERKRLDLAVGQVLAEAAIAPFDIPPHDNTAMDGYAVQAASTGGAGETSAIRLRVIGELAAGSLYEGRVGAGEAVRIMTGAPMPEGADSIVPFEETDETGLRAPGQEHAAIADVGILKAAAEGANIRRREGGCARGGSGAGGGDGAARAGDRGAGVAGFGGGFGGAAAAGGDRVDGGRAAAAGRCAGAGQDLRLELLGAGGAGRAVRGEPTRCGIARDTVAALTEMINDALAEADLLITSAGVSRGDFDVVKEVLANEGAISFWTVRMKPGKPLAFGRFSAPDGRPVPHIGLPGNPVSSLLAFELFGRPAIQRLMGRAPQGRPVIRAIADEDIVNTDMRRVYARATVHRGADGQWHARLTGPQGSGVLTSMAIANGYAVCPEEAERVRAGEECDVIMADWDHPAD